MEELDEQVRKVADGAAALTYNGGAVEFPTPNKFARPIAFNVLPLAGKVVDDGNGETDEEQKLRNETRKILEIPICRVGHMRPGARLHRPLAVDQRRVRASAVRRRGDGDPGRGARRRRVGDPEPARSGRSGPELCRADPPGPDRARRPGLALFVSNDNLRKGAALNAIQIAEALLSAARSAPAAGRLGGAPSRGPSGARDPV